MRPLSRDTVLCMSLSGRPGNFGTRFHNFLYEELGLDFVYKAFTTEDLAGAVRGIRALGIRGCAVSMPFKEACIPLLDSLDASAQAIESVNTIVNDAGALRGYNTDYGAVRALLEPLPRTGFVLRGSGGMAKAVTAALRDAGFRDGWIVARNASSGPALAAAYGFRWRPELGAAAAPLLINVTPLGMAGPDEAALAFPEGALAGAQAVFDVVARPVETPLLKRARALGKPVITGGDVIALQAAEQFALYTGVRLEPERIARAARFALLGPP